MDYMQRAVALAREVMGATSPNPAVGAVLVKDGVEIGAGATQPPGQDHAEIVAIRQASDQARGATLYCTLEPCCTWGRTPPCTKAIIAAGIAEVHFAVIDPNPNVSGNGRDELAAAGIKVVEEEAEGAKELYEAFAKHIVTGAPFVTAKFAMTLDGKIATRTGDSKWVTGSEARGFVQKMRLVCDAILVGVNTALTDDPYLTSRDADGNPLERQPLRVVLDSTCHTPVGAVMFRQPGATLIATTKAAPDARIEALERAGAEVVVLPSGEDQRVDLHELVAHLGARGVVNLLVEGGGSVHGAFFDAGLVDKVYAFVAPVIVGGETSLSPVEGSGVTVMANAWRLAGARGERIGEDWLIIGYPRKQGQKQEWQP
ncbi:MAG: bifunctional diaminohydroxyphosphoribosylaminopyrimidine deaminase/5-amino-6-(5-phosphoribosylamino)uracil reductase RibD [Chloroflexi bacterium]|nr:bifunctional diaminohydroxyphosphoribosylaminopyrimidine deaminase/5-amino-6-(5-phosphoribosylamino)uracil reductase RibD [Chloroflexota bacterium]MDA1270891.1 bifunctional diaminohydroxyphosphoribosylaminopyrimidine deaminase/5-amino-6-(5-phosphoribosylamino)uracil reductase RibD [Chloroflexota bacterium]